jgi:hypothetical protein
MRSVTALFRSRAFDLDEQLRLESLGKDFNAGYVNVGPTKATFSKFPNDDWMLDLVTALHVLHPRNPEFLVEVRTVP